jgi:hypothetical protein
MENIAEEKKILSQMVIGNSISINFFNECMSNMNNDKPDINVESATPSIPRRFTKIPDPTTLSNAHIITSLAAILAWPIAERILYINIDNNMNPNAQERMERAALAAIYFSPNINFIMSSENNDIINIIGTKSTNKYLKTREHNSSIFFFLDLNHRLDTVLYKVDDIGSMKKLNVVAIGMAT